MNPFATRYVRPGAIPFLFDDATVNADVLVQRLQAHAWRGEIIGPHGSGKSTLLATLLPLLAQAGCEPILFKIGPGQRTLRDATAEARPGVSHPARDGADSVADDDGRRPKWSRIAWQPATLLVIDGYEQLAWSTRAWLRAATALQRVGLLITAHRSVGLPTIHRTRPTFETLWRIVEQSLARTGGAGVTSELARRSFEECGGNIREALFALYDHWEQTNKFT